MVKKILFSFLILLAVKSAVGQKITKDCVLKYSKSYFQDAKSCFLEPFKWKKNQLVGYGMLSAGVGLYFADQWIHDKVPGFSRTEAQIVKYSLGYLGNGIYSLPMLAGMLVYGISQQKELPFQTALMAGKSFVIAGVFTRVLKYSLNRYRPEEGKGPKFWMGTISPFSLSFPSGHTTGAFAVATVLAKNYKHKKWVPFLSYFIASAVGISRVVGKEHWASDVMLGAFVGWSVGTVVSKVNCDSDDTSLKFTGNGLVYKF